MSLERVIMSKQINCIKMLEALKIHQKLSREELASILETNPRNILVYRNFLEQCGYKIITHKGKNGGYSLDSKYYLPTFSLDENEQSAINNALKYFMMHQDFIQLTSFESAINKIRLGASELDLEKSDKFQSFSKPKLSKKITDYYLMIKKAIKDRSIIKLKYQSLSTLEIKIFELDPYELFNYENNYYLCAKDRKDKKFKHFKLSEIRIKSFEVLNQTYFYDDDFDLNKYLGEKSIFNNKVIKIKLLLKNQACIYVNEYEIGKNSAIKWLDKNTCYFITEIEESAQLLNWILSLGQNCQILEPKELVLKVKDIIIQMQNNYL